MRVKDGVLIVRGLVAGILWILSMGEIALFFLWFTLYPYPSIRIAGIILGSFLGGLTLLNPHLVVKWRAGSNRSETVVRMESLLYLAFMVLLALGDRIHPRSAVSTILLITGIQGIITMFIRRRNLKLGWFIGGLVYMFAIVWLGIAGLFFTDLTRLADKLLFFSSIAAPIIAAVVGMKPEESMPEHTSGGIEQSTGAEILTPPLGWPTYVSDPHRRRDRR